MRCIASPVFDVNGEAVGWPVFDHFVDRFVPHVERDVHRRGDHLRLGRDDLDRFADTVILPLGGGEVADRLVTRQLTIR